MQDPITGSSNETIKWQPEPALRGTFTIITTCVITLLLCVYSSVHLNLPAINQNRALVWLRRTGWIFGALFAPEYIIFTAQIQRSRAKLLSDEAREAFKSGGNDVLGDAENGSPPRRNPWTSSHSFWALMGGIAIKPSSRKPFIPNSVQSTLTANGVSLLLKTSPHLLPDISVDEVKDKSKASSLTKLLACVQASWFCLSTITRFIQHLPVSMLELNAFAHALCTLAVYVLWWHKPLDVSQPVFVSEDELDPLLAYMWMASKTSRLPPKPGDEHVEYTVGKDPEFEAILLDEKTAAGELNSSTSGPVDLLELSDGSTDSSPTTTSRVEVTTTTSLCDTNFTSNPSSTRWVETRTETTGTGEDAKSYSYTTNHPPKFYLAPLDIHRWRLAHHALIKYKLSKPTKNLDLVTVDAIGETMEYDNKDSPLEPLWGIALLFLLGTAYGGLHALAWDAHFPSERERLLWRVSSCIVASPLAVVILAVIVILLSELVGLNDDVEQSSNTKQKEKHKPAKSKTRRIVGFFWGIVKGLTVGLLSTAIVFLYIPARAYLVYESVRTVFFLPPGAFETPVWTQYLIHVT
ncbi:hypothetical protein BKA65DRAFT_536249 [Rhexocercosporidium sp. MPI-PUGE-AT-0058]|nr:hypothetical protein BKA65DRAFT_536249 [Rhexocercosporidium sp. MPI-PUGE-AT-0058]